MSRFFLAAHGERDLEEILSYLNQLPFEPADRIAQSIQSALERIAMQPLLGMQHSQLTRLLGEEVRSRLAPPYRIFYRLGNKVPEVIAILHGAHDLSSILGRRFQ